MKNPINPKLKTEFAPLLMIAAAAIASVFFFRNFPEVVATHWNFSGEPDNFSGRAMAAFFMPGFIFSIYLMMTLMPIIDPRRKRYEQFAKTYFIFRDLIIFLLVLIYFVAGFANLGYDLNIGAWVATAVGAMFIIFGNYMGKIKHNWFMGIKTPWTLSSENVWNKTHRFSGRLFMLSGVMIIASAYVPIFFRVPLFVTAIILMIFGSTVYSYILYSKEKKNKG